MKFLCVLCLLCGFPVSGFALDRNAFTFTKYDLNVRVEPDQLRLAVRGKIILRNDSDATEKNLSLQISSSLDWRSISVEGRPAEFVTQPYVSDIDHTGRLSEAIVSLVQAVPPKASVELEIGYEGVIPPDTTRLSRIGVPAETAKHTDWDQITGAFTAVRGVGYVAWYPVAAEAASLSQTNGVPEVIAHWQAREATAEMRVQLCVWSNPTTRLTTLMNDGRGKEQTGGESGDRATCSEHVFTPLGQTVPLFAVASYETLARSSVHVSYLPEHKDAADTYAGASDRVVPFITSWFGAPHKAAMVADLPDPAAAPYENAGFLLTPLANIDPKLAEITAVHQLTHAAFPSPRLWIYEGLAHFAQVVYREQQSNRETALRFMDEHLDDLIETEKSLASGQGTAPSEQSLTNMPVEELYRSKAMFVWWMLRDMLGGPALRKTLAAYRPDQDTQSEYMPRLFERQTHRDLQWFFDDWVYHDHGLPDFRIVSVYPSLTTAKSYMVTVSVENLGAAGAEVPVTVLSEGGEITRRLEVRGKSRNSIRVIVPSFPDHAVVNDGSVPESDMSNNTFPIPKQ